MEQVIILDAKGQQVKTGRLRDKDNILLGAANGDYMNCTRESVEELQAEYMAKYKKNMQEHKAEYMSASTDLFPIKLAGFENPYDEIYNLLSQAYNNTFAWQHSFCETVRLHAENLKVRKEKADLQRAKDLLCEFICSKGHKGEFEHFCEERTGSAYTEPDVCKFRKFIQ